MCLRVDRQVPDTMRMDTQDYLANQFLIAMPELADLNFARTVTYICEHTDEGAMGVVINRPADIPLKEVLIHLDLETDDETIAEFPVYAGGPVQPDRGFVLHEPLGDWDATLKVTEQIGITASRDILAAITKGEGPERKLITLGYAGWGAGQLETEMVNNAWLSGPADQAIVFELPPDKRWRSAAALMGVDLNRLSSEAGHA